MLFDQMILRMAMFVYTSERGEGVAYLFHRDLSNGRISRLLTDR
jgi:hypothetical protein